MSTEDPSPDGFSLGHTPASFDRIVPGEPEPARVGMDASDRAGVEALPPSSAPLIVQPGANAGGRFLRDAETFTAGRDTQADVSRVDVTVSRTHAEFLVVDGEFTVRDVGSLNGTYVNRKRIDSARLVAGDEVQIGKYRLTFHPSPNRPTPSSPAEPES